MKKLVGIVLTICILCIGVSRAENEIPTVKIQAQRDIVSEKNVEVYNVNNELVGKISPDWKLTGDLPDTLKVLLTIINEYQKEIASTKQTILLYQKQIDLLISSNEYLKLSRKIRELNNELQVIQRKANTILQEYINGGSK